MQKHKQAEQKDVAENLIKTLCSSVNLDSLVQDLLQNPMVYTAFLNTILKAINNELTNVARRTEPSVLRNRGYRGMSATGWITEIIGELSSRCPTVFKILSSLIELEYNYEKKVVPTCLIYGLIMFKRCHELSRIQRINTILLTDGNTNHSVSVFFILLIYKNNIWVKVKVNIFWPNFYLYTNYLTAVFDRFLEWN